MAARASYRASNAGLRSDTGAVKLDPAIGPYLAGERFSNGLRVGFERDADDRRYRSRVDWLVEICAGKRVIHAGCVDHDREQLEHKRARGKWLHARLVEVTERCLGVDKSEAGIRHLREVLGYDDVACLDLADPPGPAITGVVWDYLILGEVLEHIDDPVGFLGSIRARYSGVVTKLVITVPNAFARENYRLARRHVEAINSDHRYWFTPYTLCKVTHLAGLTVEELRLCRNGVVKRRTWFKNLWYRRFPLLRNSILALVDLG